MKNVFYMNKSQRIYLDVESLSQDKNIKIKLEQDIDSLEFLTMSIDAKDIYQDFNSDYGVLIGRVLANGGIGIPNAKISIFIPLSDDDINDGSIVSLYPYKTPRDKNADGKRYNLLPRVAQLEQSTGLFKPKQPFGSFPIKPEIVVNQPFLNVYKKYYKYTALTNGFGDYMIFGVPIGTQTVHLSVDITDIGKFSMTPASMIKAGYPENLFTDGGEAIKSSTDLSDLPNIETQEISVDIIPFWGDVENFQIGITRQDFRIKAQLTSSFVVFGTTMTMGDLTTIGDPDVGDSDHNPGTNNSFYYISKQQETNIDLRTYRPNPFTIRVFSYLPTIPIADIVSGNVNPVSDIYELGKEEYFEFQNNGDFVLTIACNRTKVITDDTGAEIHVDDNNSFGVFTEFYGMMIFEYPDTTQLVIRKTYSKDFNGNNSARKIRGRLKIPQSFGLDSNESLTANDSWRKEYALFKGGEIYSVSQFMATKGGRGSPDTIDNDQTENKLPTTYGYMRIGGILFKVAGKDQINRDIQPVFDENNYIVFPSTGGTGNFFRYDFPANAKILDGDASDEFFGAQWLNFAVIFPQIVHAGGAGPNRAYDVADVFYNNYTGNFFLTDNPQNIFAGNVNTKYFLKGDAFRTAFVNVPRSELAKLNNIPHKGLNIRRWNINDGTMGFTNDLGITLDPSTYNYQIPSSLATTGREYKKNAWDSYYPYGGSQIGSKPTAYIFKGMYNNDCVKLLFDLNIV